jgi:hypothetical protein
MDISYHTLRAYLRYKPRLRAAQQAALPPAAEDALDMATGPDGGAPVQEPSAAAPAVPFVEATLVPE